MTSGVVIVVWNGEAFIEPCVRSLISQTTPPRRLVIVDNCSGDRSVEIIRSLESDARQSGVRVTLILEERNTGFTTGANRGLQALLEDSEGLEVAVLLNQDATLDSTWSEAVARAMAADQRVGAVGSKILMPNRLTVQHAGGYLERPRLVGRHYGHHLEDDAVDFSTPCEVEYVTAAAVALRLDAIQQVGVFDEVFSPGYYEDVDWCARARALGWKVLYDPAALATHAESTAFGLRPERLALVHRNRLVYALTYFGDAEFRRDFLNAERDYLQTQVAADERRALAVAYLWVLLLLPDIPRRRLQTGADRRSFILAVADALTELREAALGGLSRRSRRQSPVISPAQSGTVQPRFD